jgi:hypothetical protein
MVSPPAVPDDDDMLSAMKSVARGRSTVIPQCHPVPLGAAIVILRTLESRPVGGSRGHHRPGVVDHHHAMAFVRPANLQQLVPLPAESFGPVGQLSLALSLVLPLAFLALEIRLEPEGLVFGEGRRPLGLVTISPFSGHAVHEMLDLGVRSPTDVFFGGSAGSGLDMIVREVMLAAVPFGTRWWTLDPRIGVYVLGVAVDDPDLAVSWHPFFHVVMASIMMLRRLGPEW